MNCMVFDEVDIRGGWLFVGVPSTRSMPCTHSIKTILDIIVGIQEEEK